MVVFLAQVMSPPSTSSSPVMMRKMRGLAGAVGADQPGAGAGQDLEAGVAEEDLRAVLFGDIGQMDHVRSVRKVTNHKLLARRQSE